MCAFVSVEGIDCSGKSYVVDCLANRCVDVEPTAEPWGERTSKVLRENLVRDSAQPVVNFFLFMADRAMHIEEKIRPVDEDGHCVVSDRYADSTRAYQPVALAGTRYFDSQADAKIFIERCLSTYVYEPDKTIYIDVSIDTAMQRIDGDERYENRQFLESVKDNYESLISMEPDRFIVIDGEQSKDDVVQSVFSSLHEYDIV